MLQVRIDEAMHQELRVRAVKRRESQGAYVERALRSQFLVEDGAGLLEVPPVPLAEAVEQSEA